MYWELSWSCLNFDLLRYLKPKYILCSRSRWVETVRSLSWHNIMCTQIISSRRYIYYVIYNNIIYSLRLMMIITVLSTSTKLVIVSECELEFCCAKPNSLSTGFLMIFYTYILEFISQVRNFSAAVFVTIKECSKY